MTPKEKADYFVMKFKSSESQDGYNDVRDIHAAIRCALIAVGEIRDAIIEINEYDYQSLENYWYRVKQELENL
jgi:hypothetical protein